MKPQEIPVERSYQIVKDGQVVTVNRYAPTKADSIESDHSRLSFHRRRRNRLNGTRAYLKGRK